MKTAAGVTGEKLRGGFYSPENLVQICLDRIMERTGGREDLDLVEPSAGDGAFFRGLTGHPLRCQVSIATAIEISPGEAAKCDAAMRRAGLRGEAVVGSALSFLPGRRGSYDIAVGNPPYVRFQFVGPEDRLNAVRLGDVLGISLGGVSNLWIPLLLVSLDSIRDGGSFAFIVPAEFFTGVSGRVVRTWLLANTEELRIDLLAPKSFPGVLQEVVVLSGCVSRGAGGEGKLEVHDHAQSLTWTHVARASAPTWTGYLLTPEDLGAYEFARTQAAVRTMGDVARLSVATVTGANDFFSVSDDTLNEYDLHAWAVPLLPRTRNADGLVFSGDDFELMANSSACRWLLDFSPARPSPIKHSGARRYLEHGTRRRLPERYKCRIREPWYRVPVVRPGRLMMSKRSHRFPRLIANDDVSAVSTDTIYQGAMLPGFSGRERDLVASFHNSLTLLAAEINGRSFGGGVLELVPSEISRLLVPLASANRFLDDLDRTVRHQGTDSETLIAQTDHIIVDKLRLLPRDLMEKIASARETLLTRRLSRTS